MPRPLNLSKEVHAFNKALGAWVAETRRDLLLEQSDLASELGTSSAYISHVERGHKPLSAFQLVKLCAMFRIDADSILSEAREASGL